MGNVGQRDIAYRCYVENMRREKAPQMEGTARPKEARTAFEAQEHHC